MSRKYIQAVYIQIMEEMEMEVRKWNEIEKTFTDKFGWNDGIRIMLSTSSKFTVGKSITELSMAEENDLVRELRKTYKEEAVCLEKQKVKPQE